jgi:hypothetical protein
MKLLQHLSEVGHYIHPQGTNALSNTFILSHVLQSGALKRENPIA